MKKFLIGFISGAVLCGSLAVVAVEYNIYPNPYKVMVDGKETAIEGYNINDKSYFQLRDIGSAVGFQVGFDAANEMVLVSTDPNAVMPDTNADPAPTEPTEPSTELERVKASVSDMQEVISVWEEDDLIWMQTLGYKWVTLDSYIKKYNLNYEVIRYTNNAPDQINEFILTNGKSEELTRFPMISYWGNIPFLMNEFITPLNWD